MIGDTGNRARNDQEKRNWSKDRLWTLGIITTVFAFVMALAVLQGLYSPFEFFRYEAVPTKACPGEEVAVRSERRVDTAFSVTEIELEEAKWVDKSGENPSVVLPSTGAVAIQEQDRGVYETDLIVSTPAAPGEWSLQTKLIVRGTVLFVPASQEISANAPSILTILSGDSEECEVENG